MSYLYNIIAIFLLSALTSHAQNSPWYEKSMSEIERASGLPLEERIPILSQYLTVGGFTGKPPLGFNRSNPEDQQVFERVQTELLSIPGHAQFFVKPIQETYDRVAQGRFNTPEPKVGGDMVNIGRIFQRLSQLPSPETVRVLGDFIVNDKVFDSWLEESRNMKSQEQFERLGVHLPLALEAATALYLLPLKSKPVKNWSGDDYDEVLKWRSWYQQIKDGRRTFSFEGDPQEYDLTGPVREARNPDVARITKRPGVSLEASAAHVGESSTHSATPWIAGILTMMAGIGLSVYLHKKRQVQR